MAKKSVIEREKKRRVFYEKHISLRKFLKNKIRFSTSLDEKLFYNFQLQKLPKKSSSSMLLKLFTYILLV